MACFCNNHLYLFCQIHHSITTSIASPSRAFPSCLTTTFRVCNAQSWSTKPNYRSMSESVSPSASSGTFIWDDFVRNSDPETISDDPSDLNGYFEKIKICNRGADMRFDFIPFVIEDQIVGYIHNGFAEHLRKFQYVFEFLPDNSNGGSRGARMTLNSSLKTPEDRTRAVGEVVKGLGEQLIPGIRNEPHGITCGENMVKECEEEAGIPRSISSSAIPVGAVSYMDIDGYRYKRDVLFCYDLKLPESFIPKNEDGEVESFKLISVTHVANVIRRTYLFKPNCCLVIIDFLFRHGYILPECFGYLDLLQSLRSGDCS